MASLYTRIIHLGDAGRGRIMCGTPEKRKHGQINWTWRPELVTCERCLAMYRKKCGEKGE